MGSDGAGHTPRARPAAARWSTAEQRGPSMLSMAMAAILVLSLMSLAYTLGRHSVNVSTLLHPRSLHACTHPDPVLGISVQCTQQQREQQRLQEGASWLRHWQGLQALELGEACMLACMQACKRAMRLSSACVRPYNTQATRGMLPFFPPSFHASSSAQHGLASMRLHTHRPTRRSRWVPQNQCP